LSTYLFLLLLSSLSIHRFSYAQAQSFIPVVVSAPAFARSVNKLFVAGGANSLGPDVKTNQFMSLDLAVPWNSTAPAWTKLADSPSQRLFPATFSSDEQTLYVFHIPGSTSPWYYSVKDNVWHELWPVRFQDTNWEGFGAVTDPRTGLVYIAGGYDNANYNANYMRGLDIFDPITLSIHMESLPAPDTLFPMRWYYANVWSKARNSVVYWGGINKKVNMPFSSVENGVTALFTDTWSWYTLVSPFSFFFLVECHPHWTGIFFGFLAKLH
jgi:hypothetical protein